MKKVILVLTKIALGLLFLYNIGLFNIQLPKSENIHIDQTNQMELNLFIKERIAVATAKGITYSPHDYFTDLIAVEEKMKILSNTYKEQFLISQLFCLTTANRKLFTEQETEAAVAMYRDYIDPGREAQGEFQAKIDQDGSWKVLKESVCLKIIPWLFHFYLKNLLLAFALIWLWWYQEYKTLRIKNPFSFIFSVLAYPYFIGKVWYEKANRGVSYFSFEVELRKTKSKFFTLLSPNEISDLKRFANNKLGRKDWKRYLRNQGLTAKRSLASALLATLFFSFFSLLLSGTVLASEKSVSQLKVVITQSDQSPPGLNYETFNLSSDQDSPILGLSNNSFLESILLAVRQSRSWKSFERRLLYCFHFCTKIEHIPLTVNYML
jgi:hypothetical protein